MIVAAILVAALNLRGIQISARTGTILGSFEIGVFVLLAVWLIVKAGGHNTGSVFTLHYATIKGYKGFSGIAAGSIYTILAFIGFEASAPLAEEARNPRRTIQVAVVASCLVIGLFYVLTTYAGDVFYGPDKFVSFGALGGGSPWIQLGRDVWGAGWVIVFLATILTGVMIAIYMVFNLSCIFFYLRRQRSEFNVLLHLVIPVLGILAFIPAWLTALGLGSSFLKFVTPLAYPSSLTGPIIGIWFVIGLGVLAYLYARHPERLPEMKRVFADDVLPAPDEPVATGDVK
jgi:amino acid transporter